MTKKFIADKPSIGEIRALRQPRTESVWLPMDAGLLERIDDLEREIRAERRIDEREHRSPVAPGMQAELDTRRAEAEQGAVCFTFVELPRRVYQAVIDLCPPRDAKRRWDDDTFAPLLMAASCLEPEMTSIPRADFVAKIGGDRAALAPFMADAAAIYDEWGASAVQVLTGAAVLCQEQLSKAPFGRPGSPRTNGSGPSSTSASATGDASGTTSS